MYMNPNKMLNVVVHAVFVGIILSCTTCTGTSVVTTSNNYCNHDTPILVGGVVTATPTTTITTTTTTTMKYRSLNNSNDPYNRIVSIRGGATTTTTTTNGRTNRMKSSIPTTTTTNHYKSNEKQNRNNSKGNTNKVVIRGTGAATIMNEIFNLVKCIVGVGVLSLPAGIGNFGNHPTALYPSLLLIGGMGVLSAYGFAIIGKVCAYTQATTYKEAWAKSIHPNTSWIPALSATCKTFLACLALSMVLADTFVGLLQPFRNPIVSIRRTNVLLTITISILLPLCWMKNLTTLAPFSLLGVLGMGFTAIAMTVRYFDQSYVGPGGQFYQQIAQQYRPNFGTAGYMSVFQPRALILVCMLSTAYMAHFNAPKFYHELYNNTLERYHTVVASSFGISILMIGYITAIGFVTFGSAASGLVLNNYSTNDLWMSASRIAVAVALVFSYPLAFQGCRDGVIDLIQLVQPKLQRTTTTLNVMTITLLVLLTTLAVMLKDVSFVLALGGATLGNALTYLYPALMYSAIVKKQNRNDQKTGVFIANCSAVLGVVMGIIGAKMALEK